MSLTTTTTYETVPSATQTLVVQVTNSPAPLIKLIPFISATFSFVGSVFSLSLGVLKLVLSPLPILLYILAPVIVFIDGLTTCFIRWPYWTFLYLAEAFYPLYVLFGVACLTGCVFGLGGRLLYRVLIASFFVEPGSTPGWVEEPRRDNRGKDRREKVKFEG